MAFCSKCGTEVGAGAAFCPKCGAAQNSGPAPTGGAVAEPVQATQPGMSENVGGLLCYLLGWVTGIIFFLIDKRPFVRFHAAQSMVTFGGLHILNIVLGIIFGAGMMFRGGYGAFGMGAALYSLIGLVTFVLWILLMVKAYQHEKFEVPIVAGIAKSFSGT
ncbi:MAG TPA: zinc-ribbon domain-containing protein [Candidatus Acidoferrales bacterium]|nr:zinc-ribbon domain-containing protein [Candidatus Acidoferrales bacterium]